MILKELKYQLAFGKDEDEVVVRFPDLGTGGYDDTDKVGVIIEDGKVTIIAALL